jgi:hypothetical protein
MTDMWVCSQCHSINRRRNDRCYKCGAGQEMATGALADTRSERAIQERAFNPYRSSLVFAIIASAFIVAVVALSVIVLSESLAATRFIRDQIPAILSTGEVDTAELARLTEGVVVPARLQVICALGALLFFAVWLSRAVANVPALGGGDPGVSPTRAFITPLVPIYNLFKTPPIIQGVLYRLDATAGGFFMLLLAWIGLVGSWIVDFFASLWVNLRIITVSFNADTLGEAIDAIRAAYDLQVIVDIVTSLMVAAGGLILVVVIFRIERRARARDREIRAAFASGVGLGSLAVPDPAAMTPVTAEPEPAAAPTIPADAAPPAVAAPPPVEAPSPVDAPPPPILQDALAASGTVAAEPGPETAPPLSAPEQAGGLRLLVRVGVDGIQASVDGDAWERSSIEELRQAGPAILEAGGTALISAASPDVSAGALFEAASALRAVGIPTEIVAG